MISMQKLIIIVSIFCAFSSCRNPWNQSFPDGGKNERGHVEDMSIERYWVYTMPVDSSVEEVDHHIIDSALNGLKLIQEPWEQTVLIEDTTLNFLRVRATSNNTIVALAISYRHMNFEYPSYFFFELSLDGQVIAKEELEGVRYDWDDYRNLQEIDGDIRYFTSQNIDDECIYDLDTKEHRQAEDKKLNWQAINDWRNQGYFPSPDSSKTIDLSGTYLFLISEGKKELLIKQVADGTWSFGSGCWNADGNTFYFDNTGGATMCIWRIDFTAKTLAKIVPEHNAKNPAILGNSKIVYCEGHYIKIAQP